MRLSSLAAFALLAAIAAACGRADSAGSGAPATLETAEARPASGPRPVATAAPIAAPAAPADPFVLVVLGDSFVSGDELPPDAILSAQLAGMLADNGVDAEVRDASEAGDAAAGLSRFDGAVAAEADGVIIALGGDDLARAAAPADVEAALSAVIERAQGRGLWVGLVAVEAPLGGVTSEDPSYEDAFNAVFDDLARSYRVEIYPDYFSGLIDYETGETRPELFLPDGVHPSDLGVAIIAEGIADWLADELPAAAKRRAGG